VDLEVVESEVKRTLRYRVGALRVGPRQHL